MIIFNWKIDMFDIQTGKKVKPWQFRLYRLVNTQLPAALTLFTNLGLLVLVLYVIGHFIVKYW